MPIGCKKNYTFNVGPFQVIDPTVKVGDLGKKMVGSVGRTFFKLFKVIIHVVGTYKFSICVTKIIKIFCL